MLTCHAPQPRHIWNAIWSDMSIESMFGRYGHQAGGLTGLILGLLPAVSRWTLSWHTCSQLWGDLLAMKDKQTTKQPQLTRKRLHAGLPETIRSSEDQISSSKLHRSPCCRHSSTWAIQCGDRSSRDGQ